MVGYGLDSSASR